MEIISTGIFFSLEADSIPEWVFIFQTVFDKAKNERYIEDKNRM
ncbi:hypothetical protein RM549_00835 [Salegentibacter sp. F188]|uniref:Uncharacterized protein n=1 Tax=Autumnicola patrickiae TaxID=3075591 RepID=A0ABU3DX57_9FLAO|nr:hypothetical protein [Salegentibacter sp. F188]MDT0688313.1 hypothetical protein [Salegentibacter sp. F188]